MQRTHGLLQGKIEIFNNLPPELAQGAFAKEAVLPVPLRFSSNPGDSGRQRIHAERACRRVIGGRTVALAGHPGSGHTGLRDAECGCVHGAHAEYLSDKPQAARKTTNKVPGRPSV